MDEQQIRAAAIQASAALCAPITSVSGGEVASVTDVLFVADVFAGYIESGWAAALQIHDNGARQESAHPVVPPAEPPVRAVPDAPAVQPEPVPAEGKTESAPPPEPDSGKVIKAKFGTGGSSQGEARSKIERIRKESADQILAQAKVAKVRAHKDRLIDEAETRGLEDFPVVIKGATMTLGAYLSSL